MSRRKRPPVVDLENGEFVFGPAPVIVDNTPPRKARKLAILPKEEVDPADREIDLNLLQDSQRTEIHTFTAVNPSTSNPSTNSKIAIQHIADTHPTPLDNNPKDSNVITLLDDNSVDSQETRLSTSPEVMIIDDDENFERHKSRDAHPSASKSATAVIDSDDFYGGDFFEIITPINEVLSVFPDADSSEVERLLFMYQDHVETVVQHMLEKGYAKVDIKNSRQSKINEAAELINKDFFSATWETSADYRSDAVIELINNFPFIRNDCIAKLFRKEKQHYFHTVKYIEEATGMSARMSYHDNGFSSFYFYDTATMQRIRAALDTHKAAISTSSTSTKDNKDYCVIHTRVSTKSLPRPRAQIDVVLAAEISWLRKRKHAEVESKDKAMAEELNYQLASDENALMECGCCYAEYPFEQLVQCTEAHLFCKQCLQRYAEQTLFGDGRTTLKCMNTMGDPCPGVFTESMLRASLSEKVLAKFSEAQTRDILKAAQIEDLVTCHDCQYQVSMSTDAGKVMHCPQCNKDTCRECGDEAHIPLKCSEVEKKGDTAKRLTVEEALSKARIRECPKCKTRFYKLEGCNKMTCSCGINICYICRKDITKEKYQHFCQTAHCNHKSCNRCRLFTNTIEDDALAMREAGLKALQTVEETAPGDNSNASAKAGSTNNVRLSVFYYIFSITTITNIRL